MCNSAQSKRPAGKHMGRLAFAWFHCLNQPVQEAGCKTIPSGFVLNKNKPHDFIFVSVMQTIL